MTDTASPSAALPLTRRLTVQTDCLKHEPLAGSMLRGAWGHALMALSPLPHQDGQYALHASCPTASCLPLPPPAQAQPAEFSILCPNLRDRAAVGWGAAATRRTAL